MEVTLYGHRVPYLFSGIGMLDGEVYDAVEAESLSYNSGHIVRS